MPVRLQRLSARVLARGRGETGRPMLQLQALIVLKGEVVQEVQRKRGSQAGRHMKKAQAHAAREQSGVFEVWLKEFFAVIRV